MTTTWVAQGVVVGESGWVWCGAWVRWCERDGCRCVSAYRARLEGKTFSPPLFHSLRVLLTLCGNSIVVVVGLLTKFNEF